MRTTPSLALVALALALVAAVVLLGRSSAQDRPAGSGQPAVDAVAQAQTPAERPEQKLSDHDRSNVFVPENAPPSSPAFQSQPEQGQPKGFDFARDPLNAKKPMQTLAEVMQADVAEKPDVMARYRALLESRYDLTPRLDPEAKLFLRVL